MKCVILCGGMGTRLQNETEFKPKPLVLVGNRPILWHIMKIYDHFNIKDFILPLGYKGEMIKRFFMEYKWRNNDFTINLRNNELNAHNSEKEIENWDVSCINTGLKSGTALRLYKVKHLLEDDENFCLTYGDGVADVNIQDLIEYHKKMGKIVTITGLHPRSKFGLMIANKSNIVEKFTEKPILPDTINGGFMVINRRIFEFMSESDSMLVDSTLPRLAKMNEVAMYEFDGFWHCMDTQKDLNDLNSFWNNNPPWKVWNN